MRVICTIDGWVVLGLLFGRESVVFGPTDAYSATQWAARQ